MPACDAMTPRTASARTPSSAGMRVGPSDTSGPTALAGAAAALATGMHLPRGSSAARRDALVGRHRLLRPRAAAEARHDAVPDGLTIERVAPSERVMDSRGEGVRIIRC